MRYDLSVYLYHWLMVAIFLELLSVFLENYTKLQTKSEIVNLSRYTSCRCLMRMRKCFSLGGAET